MIDGAPHPVDAFVREALHARGLEASAPADELTLLRRLSLDLTGLPPTASERARAFAASADPDKLEETIERFLASPAASERWAAVRLDLARYADSAGHGSDPLRTIWRYRDWLIEAFDRNLPFDEFTVQQLAGDLLPDAGTDERLATAFHRNTMTNTEGGTDDEEFRVLAVKDRVNTTMQVWMGLTAGCAECHSHKYDPISHWEYYELFDLFNQTADNDRGDEAPLLDTPTAAQRAEFDELGVVLESARAALAARRAELAGDPVGRGAAGAGARGCAAAFDRSAIAGVVADEGETVSTLEGDAWLVESSRDKATRRLTVNPIDDAPGALRIDALAAEGLPGGGPGRSGGNFVLTSLRVRALPAPGDSAPLVQRVRVELPGKQRILSLAEVQLVGAEGSVLDAEISASQSSTAYGGDPGRAVDGETDGAYEAGSVTHTATEDDPWWEGRLAAPARVAGVRLWTRTDGDLESRLHGLRVVFLDGAGSELWRSAPAPAFGPSCDIGPALGEPLLLEVAGATHEQAGFEASKAVDARLTDRDGWAVAGGTGRDQSAVFLLPELDGPRELEVTLEHDWGGRHVLGAFAAAVAPRGAESLTVLSDATVAVLAAAPGSRTPAEHRAVEDALGREDETAASLTARVDELEAARKEVGVVRTPVMEELPAERRRDTRARPGQLHAEGGAGARRGPRGLRCPARGRARGPALLRPLARLTGEPAHGARRGQPRVGASVRSRAGADRGRLRQSGGAPEPPRAARLARRRVRLERLGPPCAAADDRELRDLPPGIGHGLSRTGARPGRDVALALSAAAAGGGDGPGHDPARGGAALLEALRPVGLPAPARRALAGGLQRSAQLAGEHGRGSLPAGAVRVPAPDDPVSHARHLRRAEP